MFGKYLAVPYFYLPLPHSVFCMDLEIFELLCPILGCSSSVGTEFLLSPSKSKDVFHIKCNKSPSPAVVFPLSSAFHTFVRRPSSRLFVLQVGCGRGEWIFVVPVWDLAALALLGPSWCFSGLYLSGFCAWTPLGVEIPW